ncbi:hypothetical protein Tco_1448160 [Tanacetum coccineum]
MSSASSTVTYTSVDTDSEPGRAFWPADEELSDGGSPRVIVYGYDGLPIQPVAPPSPDYIPGPEDPQAPRWMSVEEIKQIVAQRVANSIEAIAIYETKTNMARKSISQTKQEEDKAYASSPLPIVPHPYGNPNHVCAPRGFRAAMGRLRASSPSTHHLLHPPLQPLPSSLYLPPPVPISSPLLSPPLPTSLFIPPPVDHKEDIPKVELPPHKRLCLTTLTSRYEVGESSTAARLTRGHRADYGFIGTLDVETRCQRAEEVSYGIRDAG